MQSYENAIKRVIDECPLCHDKVRDHECILWSSFSPEEPLGSSDVRRRYDGDNHADVDVLWLIHCPHSRTHFAWARVRDFFSLDLDYALVERGTIKRLFVPL